MRARARRDAWERGRIDSNRIDVDVRMDYQYLIQTDSLGRVGKRNACLCLALEEIQEVIAWEVRKRVQTLVGIGLGRVLLCSVIYRHSLENFKTFFETVFLKKFQKKGNLTRLLI